MWVGYFASPPPKSELSLTILVLESWLLVYLFSTMHSVVLECANKEAQSGSSDPLYMPTIYNSAQLSAILALHHFRYLGKYHVENLHS